MAAIAGSDRQLLRRRPRAGVRGRLRLPDQHERLKRLLQDPFDYPAEDRLVELHRRFLADCAAVRFDVEPGFTVAYYGPLDNPGERPPSVR